MQDGRWCSLSVDRNQCVQSVFKERETDRHSREVPHNTVRRAVVRRRHRLPRGHRLAMQAASHLSTVRGDNIMSAVWTEKPGAKILFGRAARVSIVYNGATEC